MALPMPGGERQAPRLEYPESATELEWLVAHAGAALGLHAQTYDPDRSGVPFDPEVVHARRHTVSHRDAAAKEQRVRTFFGELAPEQRRDVVLVFTPRQWAAGLAIAFRLPRSNYCLAALAADTERAKVACRARNEGGDGRAESPLVFLDWAVGNQGQGYRVLVAEVMREAATRLNAALGAYDALRLQHVAAEERRVAMLFGRLGR